MNCYNLINRLAAVTSNIAGVQWQTPGATCHFQRNLFETQQINIKNTGDTIFRNVRNCLPVGTATVPDDLNLQQPRCEKLKPFMPNFIKPKERNMFVKQVYMVG
jgi:hypothetical protein